MKIALFRTWAATKDSHYCEIGQLPMMIRIIAFSDTLFIIGYKVLPHGKDSCCHRNNFDVLLVSYLGLGMFPSPLLSDGVGPYGGFQRRLVDWVSL